MELYDSLCTVINANCSKWNNAGVWIPNFRHVRSVCHSDLITYRATSWNIFLFALAEII